MICFKGEKEVNKTYFENNPIFAKYSVWIILNFLLLASVFSHFYQYMCIICNVKSKLI